MASRNTDDAASRRREQNRLAQRRFRWRQSESKKSQAAKLSQTHNPIPPTSVETPVSSHSPGPVEPGTSNSRDNQHDDDDDNDSDVVIVGESTNTPASSAAAFVVGKLPCVYNVLQKYTLLDFARVQYDGLPGKFNPEESETPSTYDPVREGNVNGWQPSSTAQHEPPELASVAPSTATPVSNEHQYVSENDSSPAMTGKISSATTMSGTGTGTGTTPSSGSAPRRGPLHIAAQKGNDRIVRTLLQYRSDCNAKDGDGLTPLMHAVIGGHVDVVASLLAHGARVDELDPRGRSAVHLAVAHADADGRAHEALLRLLLERCRGTGLIDRCDVEGQSALLIAVENLFEAGVSALLENGANPSPTG